MGRVLKAVAFVVGLAAFGAGLWLVVLICFLYVALSMRPRRARVDRAVSTRVPLARHFPVRVVLGTVLALLSLVAFSSGGLASPYLLIAAGTLLLCWPYFRSRIGIGSVVPVKGSILLKQTRVPFRWYSVAEIKPGTEDFARGLASIDGRLLVDYNARSIFVVAVASALKKEVAYESIVSQFRQTARSISGARAYLLPLDAGDAFGRLRRKIHRRNTMIDEHLGSNLRMPAMMALVAHDGFVREYCGYDVEDAEHDRAVLPEPSNAAPGGPLLWEVIETSAKAKPWPLPDADSDFLQSFAASGGEPVGERLAGFRGDGDALVVQSLGGASRELTRSQLRAITAIYS